MSNLPRNLPEILRKHGLKVVEIGGWETRGRPPSTGGFAPVGVLNHHTGASAKGWSAAKILTYVKWMFLTGRPSDGLPPPLCHMSLGRDGTVYLGAAGRANHAGKAKARGTVAAGDGNKIYVGIEWMLSGTEAIPKAQRDAGVLLNAVLLDEVLRTSPATVAAHYETSITGKWDIGDPSGVSFKGHRVMNMATFRRDVQNRLASLNKKPAAPAAPAKPTRVSKARASLEDALKHVKPGSARDKAIRAALKALPKR